MAGTRHVLYTLMDFPSSESEKPDAPGSEKKEEGGKGRSGRRTLFGEKCIAPSFSVVHCANTINTRDASVVRIHRGRELEKRTEGG